MADPIEFSSEIEVKLVDVYGSEHTIVNAARVSLDRDIERSPSSERGTETLNEKDMGLIDRLLGDGHGTPFEKAGFIFKINAPIFVLHQLQRHRWSSFNEQSGRYSDFKPVFYIPTNLRKQTGKRMDYKFEKFEDDENEFYLEWFKISYAASFIAYEQMISSGVARELARMVLPTAIFSSAYWSINLRSLSNFLSLRLDPHAQEEIQQVAEGCLAYLVEYFPYIGGAYKNIAELPPERDIASG